MSAHPQHAPAAAPRGAAEPERSWCAAEPAGGGACAQRAAVHGRFVAGTQQARAARGGNQISTNCTYARHLHFFHGRGRVHVHRRCPAAAHGHPRVRGALRRGLAARPAARRRRLRRSRGHALREHLVKHRMGDALDRNHVRAAVPAAAAAAAAASRIGAWPRAAAGDRGAHRTEPRSRAQPLPLTQRVPGPLRRQRVSRTRSPGSATHARTYLELR